MIDNPTNAIRLYAAIVQHCIGYGFADAAYVYARLAGRIHLDTEVLARAVPDMYQRARLKRRPSLRVQRKTQ